MATPTQHDITRGRPPTYPWQDWFNKLSSLKKGEALKFIQGKDFQCDPKSFQAAWYDHNVKVSVNIIDNEVFVALRQG